MIFIGSLLWGFFKKRKKDQEKYKIEVLKERIHELSLQRKFNEALEASNEILLLRGVADVDHFC